MKTETSLVAEQVHLQQWAIMTGPEPSSRGSNRTHTSHGTHGTGRGSVWRSSYFTQPECGLSAAIRISSDRRLGCDHPLLV